MLQLAIQCFAIESQNLGGQGSVPACDTEHVPNVASLDFFHCQKFRGIIAAEFKQGASIAANFFGQIVNGNPIESSESHGAFDGISQFADVAGPCIIKQLLRGGVGQSEDIFSVPGGEFFEVVLCQKQDIGSP